jgi:glucose-1-phosphate thymidylyltransferase
MRGIVLCGGLGTRLQPLTTVINKHLLPVYDRPMVCFPIQKLVDGGVTELAVVIGNHGGEEIKKFIGAGEQFGLQRVTYYTQIGEGGIAEAIGLCEDFVSNEKFVTILGDNIFEDAFDFSEYMSDNNAVIFIKEVEYPERFGVAEIDVENNVVNIVEKPVEPVSNLAVTGLYIFPKEVFSVIKKLKASARGEKEVTDLNNHFISQGRMKAVQLEYPWVDGGTFDSLYYANTLMAQKAKGKKHSKKFDKILGIL